MQISVAGGFWMKVWEFGKAACFQTDTCDFGGSNLQTRGPSKRQHRHHRPSSEDPDVWLTPLPDLQNLKEE